MLDGKVIFPTGYFGRAEVLSSLVEVSSLLVRSATFLAIFIGSWRSSRSWRISLAEAGPSNLSHPEFSASAFLATLLAGVSGLFLAGPLAGGLGALVGGAGVCA